MVFVEAPKKATATRCGTQQKRRESGRRKSPRPPRGFDGTSFGPHALRATASTNALDRGADLGKVQEWLGVTIPMTVATVGFATNYAARGKYWAHDNWGPELSPFEGSTFKRSLPEIQKERLSAVSQRLGDVVKVPLGAKLHTPTLISNSFIALQQCLINAPVHIVSVRHPDDDIILAAAELSKGVGKKWLLLPGLVNPLLALGGRSVLSGVPAGAYHLTGDLKQVARDYLLKNIQAGPLTVTIFAA